MKSFDKDKFKRSFIEIAENINPKSKKNLEYYFLEVINLLELPEPNSELRKYFYHPSILRNLLLTSMNIDILDGNDRFELQPYLSKTIKKLYGYKKNKYFVRYRVLNPEGRYPNIELDRNNCHYSIQNQLPVIWTKNTTTIDQTFLDLSVINWLTRNELKLATAILCSSQEQLFYLYFTSYNMVEVSWDCYSKIPKHHQKFFLKEYFDLNIKFKSIGVRSWHRTPIYDSTYYNFGNFKNNKTSFEKLFDNFSLKDELLLRTCNYFVKSKMHWDNSINSEEAISCILFCLEGCLHLIQRKYGDYGRKINFSLLNRIFTKEIEYGENLLTFIKMNYSTRITLVHPEPKWGAKWKPYVHSDDFFENFSICWSLLNFILIDEYKER